MAFTYRVIPFLGTIKTGMFSNENAATVSQQLQTLIDAHTQEGWELYSINKVAIEVKPGCLGSLLGQKAAYLNFDQAIFRRTAG